MGGGGSGGIRLGGQVGCEFQKRKKSGGGGESGSGWGGGGVRVDESKELKFL